MNNREFRGLDYNVLFGNIDAVTEAVSDSKRIAHKFHSAKVNSYFKELNFNKLVDLNNRYQLGLNLDSSKSQWIIDEAMDLNTIAKIFNDEYGRSQLNVWHQN